jgi:hypothetical protein
MVKIPKEFEKEWKARTNDNCLITSCDEKIKHVLIIRYTLPGKKKESDWLSVNMVYRFCNKHKKEIAAPMAELLNQVPNQKIHAEVIS